jgi:nucleoside-diphosphate-sugar epimerase
LTNPAGVVLVTGGAGYIGSTLVGLLLNAGRRVRVLDSLLFGGESLLAYWADPAFELHRGDIRDSSVVRSAVVGVDAVVHLAAIVGDPACARQPDEAESVNTRGSHLVFEESRAAGVSRFVFASTCSNYGKMSQADVLVDEASALRPVSLYARTKVAFERFLLAQPPNARPAVTCLRFATVFGVAPRMRFDLTVNQFTAEALTEGRVVVFGQQFWRPYVHVRDAARAIGTVLEAPPDSVAGQVFNVGSSEQNFRKQDIAARVAAALPGTIIEYVERDEDPRDYRVSFARIERILDFRVTRTLDQGINEVAALIRAGLVLEPKAPRYTN